MEEIFKLYQEICSLFGENDFGEELHQQIHRIIQETIDRIPEESRIAIRPAGGDTENTLRLYDFSRKNIIGIVDRKNRGGDFCGYPCLTMDSISPESCDCIIISSHSYRQAIKEELETLHIPYVDFYDELEKQGIRLDLPHQFYEEYKDKPQLIVNYLYLRFLRSEAGQQREIALNELLQIAVEYKDFVLISSLYQDCGGEDGEFPLLKTVWEKSEHLLALIQNKIQKRKQKDIILFWTDAVPYNRFHYLPETMELSKQGTSFQRAYAPAPHTNGVLRAMFRNMLPIDDFPQNQEKIDSGNSSLIQFMEHEGYKVRIVGYSTIAMGKEHLIDIGSAFEPCGAKWWKGIVDLLQSPEPCFYLFHFMESHRPYYVPDLKELVNPGTATKTQMEEQVKYAFGYIDRCLLLYHKLLGNKTQIFLSDHGLASSWTTTIRFDDKGVHPYCFVVGESIPKITVTRFFPYTNFEKLIRWIVDPTQFSLDDACIDEMVIQDTDFYLSNLIAYMIQISCPEHGLAYRGIENYDCTYVINSLGDEFFYQIQQDGTEKLVPLEDPALRAELQNKAGTKFLDIYQYDKFRDSRKLYEAINQTETRGKHNLKGDGSYGKDF